MSIHPSLRSSSKSSQHRSVLKRYERLDILSKKGIIKEGDSVLGLIKVKTMRIKVKKGKSAAKTEDAAVTKQASGAAKGATGAASKSAATTAAKPAAGAKPAAKAQAPKAK